MSRKKLDWDSIVLETYNKLYESSYPKTNFNTLKDNCLKYEDSDWNEIILDKPLTSEECLSKGYKRIIDFYAYYIPNDIFNNIVNEQIKKYKLKGTDRSMFSLSINLGCGPTSVKKRWIEKQEENKTGLTLKDLDSWISETYPDVNEKND